MSQSFMGISREGTNCMDRGLRQFGSLSIAADGEVMVNSSDRTRHVYAGTGVESPGLDVEAGLFSRYSQAPRDQISVRPISDWST
jgi:hypothetical protein